MLPIVLMSEHDIELLNSEALACPLYCHCMYSCATTGAYLEPTASMIV